MHHQDRAPDVKLRQRLLDHSALGLWRRILAAGARTPAMAGPIDQDHAMLFGQSVAERFAHGFEIRARPMDQHDGLAAARSYVDDGELGARDVDHHPPCRIDTLQGDDTTPRDQRQYQQRRREYDHYHQGNPDRFGHGQCYGGGKGGFRLACDPKGFPPRGRHTAAHFIQPSSPAFYKRSWNSREPPSNFSPPRLSSQFTATLLS